MKVKGIIVFLCAMACMEHSEAQEMRNSFSSDKNKHEVRVLASDGFTLSIADFFGMGLADAVTGTKRDVQTSSAVWGVGYRYKYNRFRIGADIAYMKISSNIEYGKENLTVAEEKQSHLMILPTVDFLYYKSGCIELYGSGEAGVDISSLNYTKTKSQDVYVLNKYKSESSADFAFQVNPIALRIGNEHLGGFIETGLGYKGFVTIGASVRF